VKQAFVEPFPQPIRTGMHGGVKAWYRATVEEELPTTIDRVVAAGWLLNDWHLPAHWKRVKSRLRWFVGN
jgi:hypothetical protein